MNIVVILNISSFLSLVAFARLPEAKLDFFFVSKINYIVVDNKSDSGRVCCASH